MKRIEETEIFLNQCEKDLKKLRKIHIEIKQIENNRKKLSEYYSFHYFKDCYICSDIQGHYRILD